MILHPRPVNASRFTFVPAENLYIAEASDFGRDFPLGRVYDDAADLGFTLVSERGETVYAQDGEERDREGDLLYEEYAPVSGPLTARVRIFND